MMLMFALTTLVLLVIVAAMSIGVFFGRKPIGGSCGGVGAALGEKDYSCQFCGGDPDKCEERNSETSTDSPSPTLAYDATTEAR